MVEGVANLGRIGCADRRELHRTGRPYHQLHAEMILEIAHGAAHGAVGHAQLIGRSGKAQVAGRSFEARQRIQGRVTAVHDIAVHL